MVKYKYELKFSIDLKKYIDKLIESYEVSSGTAERVFEEDGALRIDESRDLYLTEISFNYGESDKNIENLRVEGFVLEK